MLIDNSSLLGIFPVDGHALLCLADAFSEDSSTLRVKWC